jgi:DNA-directed RNA polymerase specialized sigma24 family protein
MDAISFLKQVEKLDTLIKNKLIEKTQWRDIALGITANMEGERVQSSGRPSKMADAIDKCVDMEAEIDNLIDRLVDTKRDVISVIEQLNATEYDVLHKRYIQFMALQEIADAKNKQYGWVTTTHGRAVANVKKILEERENS